MPVSTAGQALRERAVAAGEEVRADGPAVPAAQQLDVGQPSGLHALEPARPPAAPAPVLDQELAIRPGANSPDLTAAHSRNGREFIVFESSIRRRSERP